MKLMISFIWKIHINDMVQKKLMLGMKWKLQNSKMNSVETKEVIFGITNDFLF
jgi:hypothetical protein